MNIKQVSGVRGQGTGKGPRHFVFPWNLKRGFTPHHFPQESGEGFTLIETMAAITLLTIAIVAPMTLTVQSLTSAYYARDEITAFYLAQEALESVRSVRDGNILKIAEGQSGVNIFDGIPSTTGAPFTIDGRNNDMELCSGICQALDTDGSLYGYDSGSSWTPTNFTRTVEVSFVGGDQDEAQVSVTVTWKSGNLTNPLSFTLSEDLYRWVQDGSGV